MRFTKLPLILFAAACAMLPDTAHSLGVAVTKQQDFHDDDSAKPFVFDSVIDSGRVLTFTRGSERFNIERTTFIRFVEVLPAIPKGITTEEQIDAIRTKTAEIQDFSEQFALAKPILAGHLKTLQETLEKIDAGQVRVRGDWVSRKQYEADQAEAKAKAKAKAERELAEIEERKAERQAFEAAQRAKGLVEYRGEWLKPDVAAKRREEDQFNARMSALLKERSVTEAVIEIFQAFDEGALCNLVRGNSATMRTGFCFVRDITMTAEDELYKGTLYYAGTFSYINRLDTRRTVAAYCVKKENAVAYLRDSLGGGSNEVAGKSEPDGRPEPKDQSGNSLPEELQFADGFGSGFFVGKNGHIVTNHHVVKDATKIRVYHNNQLHRAEIITVSGVSDLAILKVEADVPGLVAHPL